MICPFCLHKKSNVFNSRTTSGGMLTWRRRRCLNCQKSFTTQEAFDPTGAWKVTSAKKSAPYSRTKLLIDLLRACDHRDNYDAASWYIFETIERQLYILAAKNQGILSTKEITEIAATALKRFDITAYVKYISQHQLPLDAASLKKQLRKK